MNFFKNYKCFLSEMAYPKNFNMSIFRTLTSFKERRAYCDTRLEKLGEGSSRIVYKIDDDRCLKLAKNSKGIAQNEAELELSEEALINNSLLFAQVLDNDDNYYWLEMELARDCSYSGFRKIMDIGFEQFTWLLEDMYYDEDLDIYEVLPNIEQISIFAGEIIQFSELFNICIGDLMRIQNFGISGKDRIVIIDYGLNDDIYSKHYEPGRHKK